MDTTKTPAPNAPEADTTPADLVKAEAPRAAETESATATAAETETDAELTDKTADDEEFDEDLAEDEEQPGGVGAAASAIVAAGLSLVALSGTWGARVLAERQGLMGQIEGDKSAPPAEQIAALYGDGWQLTALVNGVLSTLALLIAVFVLARPAFGAPGRELPAWVRAVSWAAVVLGAIGALVFGFLYFLPLPKVPA
ncbi:hypothetical protein [Streptomyces sp. NBC_01408]|uniref:hypothetical protein n=1 Tax=Streptomyces sp. NBC_01408 TaxID=2903855 RepID=UPI00224D935B|nr:hypothetical protein [Streptomyces sp. NBC_01408]MCX4690845.1 hypothetical protein [Streptomyces sp. NBC_01408]